MTDVIFRNVDPAVLEKLAALMEPAKPEMLTPEWTIDYAEALLRDLASAALGLLNAVVAGGGRIDADDLRGSDGGRSLRGLTGPITKAMERLVRAGRLPVGLPIPVSAEYDPAVRAWQRTKDFVMPSELVPTFEAAFARIGR
jgi:hypothetical protein